VECFASFYAYNLSFRALVRVWDLLVMRVPDVLPLTLLAVIYENREEMAGMPIEEILPRLKSGLREISPEVLVAFIFHPPRPSLLDQCIIS